MPDQLSMLYNGTLTSNPGWPLNHGDSMRKFLFALLLPLLVACAGEVTGEQYIDRAKEYIEEADYASASIELQNALKLDSSLAEARWLLGGIYLENGNVTAAEHEFQRAQALGWSADDIVPALARTSLAQGRFDDVLALEPEGLSRAATASLLSQQAIAALGEGDPEQVRALLEQAASSDPSSTDVKLARATLLLSEQEYTAALVEIDAVLEVVPQLDRAWRLKAQALMRLERLEEARDALDKSIEYSRFAYADRVARALLNIQFGEFEAAQADAAVLLEVAPEEPSANYVQGLLHFHDKNFGPAIKSFSAAEGVAEEYPVIYYHLAIAYQFEADAELSRKYASQYATLVPDSLPGRKLRAITLIQGGEYADALSVLRPLLESAANDLEALNIMANALLLDDQAYGGLVIYRQIRELDPAWEIVPLRKEARLITGGSGEVPDQLPGLADSDPNFPQAEILEIVALIEQEDYPAAIEAARSYQVRDIESRSPYHVLGKIYMAAGQNEEAKEAFEKVLRRAPGDPFANLNLAELALEAGDISAARGYYDTILEYDLSHLGALTQLAALEARENNSKAMLRRLEQAYTAHPDALEPRLNLASYYIRVGEPGKVGSLFESLGELQRSSPRVLEVVAMAQVMTGDYAGATADYERLVRVQPASAKARYLLAMSVSAEGDGERSKAELHNALELDENHVPSLLSLAKIASNEGDQELLEKYVARVVEIAPDSLDVLRLQAVAARSKGDDAGAVKFAQQAFDLVPSSQSALDVASYRFAAGQDDEARKHLVAWIDEHPDDVRVRLALANQLQAGVDVPAAIEQYRAVLDIQPGNIVALNNLAWHLKSTQPRQSLAYINRAASMAPDNPSVLDTLAVIQLESGDGQGARESIMKALEVAPDQPSIRFHAAKIHAALGEKEEAVVLLEALTAEGATDFPEQAEAAALLASLKA